MTVMLPFETPSIETRFKRPLLSASSHVTQQSAAVAIRRWWRINSDQERAEIGMVISRADIQNRNNDVGRFIPVNLFSWNGADDHEVILAAFSDQSAVVLRARAPGTHAGPSRHGHVLDHFTVVPIVLRIASIARPKDSGFLPVDSKGGIKLQMRGIKSPILALSREKSSQGWVSAEAGWTVGIDGLDDTLRAELLIDLGREAEGWARLSGSLPPLVLPEDGRAPYGPVSEMRADQTGLPPGAIVGAPAALEWAAYVDDERRAMSEFALDVARWMQIRTERAWDEIVVDIRSAQPAQKDAPKRPDLRIHLKGNDILSDGARVSHQLRQALERILRSDLSPIPFERIVGQVERDYRDRKTWLENCQLASRLALQDVDLSNHEIMRLRSRFDPFWG